MLRAEADCTAYLGISLEQVLFWGYLCRCQHFEKSEQQRVGTPLQGASLRVFFEGEAWSIYLVREALLSGCRSRVGGCGDLSSSYCES